MGTESIGDAHPDAKALALRLAINPEILQVFGRHQSDGRFRLCGYRLLYPLTDKAGREVAEGLIRSGKELGPERLLADFAEAKYLYIGMLYGSRDSGAHAYVRTSLSDELARRIARGKVELLFARPGSPAGLRLLHKYGFAPIKDEMDIWSVPRERLMQNIRAKVASLPT